MGRLALGRTIVAALTGMGLLVLGVRLLSSPSSRVSTPDHAAIPEEVYYSQPSLELADLAGRAVSLEQYRGRVLLINLWASWCPPCAAELPTLQKFYEQHAADGFVTIGINDGESLGTVASFVAERELKFPIWLDPGFEAERAFGTISLPSSYLIDRHGMIRRTWIGRLTLAQLDAHVLPLLEEN